jgi:superfamily II DNA or RNA helicase
MNYFFDREFLLSETWQGFERNTARFLMFSGFDDVRIIGGSGDHGGDVLAVKKNKQWVFQCKLTTTAPAPIKAVEEVFAAGKYYETEKMVIAMSQPPSQALLNEKSRYENTYRGKKIRILEPKDFTRGDTLPEYPPARRKLRPYQEGVVEKFREALIDIKKAQIVMATGLGKTIVMAEVVSRLLFDNLLPNKRVLVLAHTNPLVNQLHQSFWFQLPKWIRTHQLSDGEQPNSFDGITFATFQTVINKLDALPPFDLILVDEAHHIGAQSYRKAIRKISHSMIAGVTATPWRGDDFDIDELLGPPIVRIGIDHGLRNGFLTEVDYRLLADNLDWEFVQQRSVNNYSISQLNRKLIIPSRDDKAVNMVRNIFKSENRKSGIIFSPTINHAEEFSAKLRQLGFKADTISHENSPKEREKIMSMFKAGKYQFIATVNLFNEGVDIPDVDMLIFMRVTHSRKIFVQQLGRGLRWSEKKDRVVVLDFVSDLRRMAEVLKLDRAVRGEEIERIGLGRNLISFNDESAGSFLNEWIKDQADLFLREGDPNLEMPNLEFPEPRGPGNIQ